MPHGLLKQMRPVLIVVDIPGFELLSRGTGNLVLLQSSFDIVHFRSKGNSECALHLQPLAIYCRCQVMYGRVR